MKNVYFVIGGIFLFGLGLYHFSGNQTITRQYTPRNAFGTQARSGAQLYKSFIENPETGEIPMDAVLNARKKSLQMMQFKSAGSLTWKELGPDNYGGRTRAILVDATVSNGSRIYAGGVSGGLFVSNNGGISWFPVLADGDANSISCIAQAPDGTIYVGTGSAFENADGSGSSGKIGNGMYKLQPGSSSMSLIPSTQPIANNLSQRWAFINTLSIDQNNGRIYAGTSQGARSSDDGGTTWNNTVMNSSGTSSLDYQVHEITVARNGNVLISMAGTMWRSTSGNMASFTNISATGTQLPSAGSVLRMAVKFAPSDDNYAYAVAVQADGGGVQGGKFLGFYRSINGGISWMEEFPPGSFDPFRPGSNAGQGYYDMLLGVHPSNKNRVFIGGVQIWRYDNGLFERAAEEFAFSPEEYFEGLYMHSDKHSYTYSHADPNVLYFGTDGGMSISKDGGMTFVPINANYNTTQYYGIAVDSDGSVMGGTQDNGTIEIAANAQGYYTGYGMAVSGGDGFDCEYSNFTNVRFSTIYTGEVKRGITGGTMAGICDRWNCNDPNFYTPIRLWEDINDATSKDSVSFTAEDGSKELILASASGSTAIFSGIFQTAQTSGTIVPGSVVVYAALDTLHDNGAGGFVGNANSTIDYNTGEYSIQFSNIPSANTQVAAVFQKRYLAGDQIILQSNTPGVNVRGKKYEIEVVLSANLDPGESVKFQDKMQSLFVFGGGDSLFITRDGLRIDQNPDWVSVQLPHINTSLIKSMTFTSDGDILYVGDWSGRVVRLSGLKNLYKQSDVAGLQADLIFDGSGVLMGIGVDPNDGGNVVLCLGGYGMSDRVLLSQTADVTPAIPLNSSSSSFQSIQGDLPDMPVFDAIISPNSNSGLKKIVIGTDNGVFSTLFGNLGTWTSENESFGPVPVMAIRQQILPRSYVDNDGVIYIGTHGRGIWSTSTMVGIEQELKEPSATNISDISIYPNPSASATNLSFNLSSDRRVVVEMYNLSGQKLKNVFNGKLSAGSQLIPISVDGLSSGVYFVAVKLDQSEVKGLRLVVK